MCTAAQVSALFDADPQCAVIYACNTLLDALASMLEVTEVDDTASYALCILLARRRGVFSDDEMEDLTDMFLYREKCATYIRVDDPGEAAKSRWKAVLFKTMAEMYATAVRRAGPQG